MRNEWVIQTIGEKLLLGFQGNKQFIRQSLNFAFNYEVIPSEARVQTMGSERFSFVSTSFTKLREGLCIEGRTLKIREICQRLGDPENFVLDEHRDEVMSGGESHCEKTMKSIRQEVFYHYEEAESCLPTYEKPIRKK